MCRWCADPLIHTSYIILLIVKGHIMTRSLSGPLVFDTYVLLAIVISYDLTYLDLRFGLFSLTYNIASWNVWIISTIFFIFSWPEITYNIIQPNSQYIWPAVSIYYFIMNKPYIKTTLKWERRFVENTQRLFWYLIFDISGRSFFCLNIV